MKEEIERTARLAIDVITPEAFEEAWRAARSGEKWNL